MKFGVTAGIGIVYGFHFLCIYFSLIAAEQSGLASTRYAFTFVQRIESLRSFWTEYTKGSTGSAECTIVFQLHLIQLLQHLHFSVRDYQVELISLHRESRRREGRVKHYEKKHCWVA